MIFFSEEIMSLDFIGLLSFIQIPIQFIIGDLGLNILQSSSSREGGGWEEHSEVA
jgi:hypothetical protein